MSKVQYPENFLNFIGIPVKDLASQKDAIEYILDNITNADVRDIICFKFEYGMKHKEISEIMHLTPHSISDYVMKLKKQILINSDIVCYLSDPGSVDHTEFKIQKYKIYVGEDKDFTETEFNEEYRRQLVMELLNQLSPIQKEIIVRRYFEEQSTREVGEILGISKTRISQIEQIALKKLKNSPVVKKKKIKWECIQDTLS